MCGINLVAGRPDALDLVRVMNDAIAHRGIRASRTSFANGSIAVGHVRLPIQGLDPDDDQPISIGRLTGAGVGEFLNFREYSPTASNDFRVFLQLFAVHGEKVFRSFDGFWSVILVDEVDGSVRVYTDPLAKKPLYVRREDGWIAISSEIKALRAIAPVTADEPFFSTVAKWGYHPGDRTPFAEIRKIPPFTRTFYDPSCDYFISSAYGTIEPRPLSRPALREQIVRAVQQRLVSDVPVSVLLSGGLDSTIIFELIKQQTHDFTVFHVDNDEAEWLDYLEFPADVRVESISLDAIDDAEVYRIMDTPVDLGSVRPQIALAREIRRHGFDVAIGGDGADELFGGYRRAMEYDSQGSDIFDELVAYHLPRLDVAMMSERVELRSPFLSIPIVEAAIALPYAERRGKKILKDLFEDLVPRPILDREKWPLKLSAIREDKIAFRRRQIETFRTEEKI